MAEFKCKPGYCIKCCKDFPMIPVTIGDLYRTWYYRRQNGQGDKFYDIFRELCNDWALIPASDGRTYAVPNSRVPCINIDEEKNICSVYDACRYVGCTSFPEDWLLDLSVCIDFASEKTVRELDCFKGITLEGERREKIKKLRELIDIETYITTGLLQSEVPPLSVVGWRPSKKIQRQLEHKLRFISDDRNAMRTLRENLIRSKALQTYEELVLDGKTEFSFCGEI